MGTVAIFGGTFNPIHVGHREILDNLSKMDFVEKILIIPSKIPPHKQVSFLAPDIDRINMCRIIAERYSKAQVSTLELDRAGKSYSIDTLITVKKLYPDREIALTIGADMVVTFDEWKDYKSIIDQATLITFSREGISVDGYNSALSKLKKTGANIIEIKSKITDVSSTKIREFLFEGRSAEGLLDEEIKQYILENNVYEVYNES